VITSIPASKVELLAVHFLMDTLAGQDPEKKQDAKTDPKNLKY
jgi:hypothetical protein